MGNNQSNYEPIKPQTQTPANSFIQSQYNYKSAMFVKSIEEKDIGLVITTDNNYKEYILSKYNEEYDSLKNKLVPNKYYLINEKSDSKKNYLIDIVNDDINMLEVTIENIKTDKETGDTIYYYKKSETDTKYRHLTNKRDRQNYCEIHNMLAKCGTYQIFYDGENNILLTKSPNIHVAYFNVKGVVLVHDSAINSVNFSYDVYEIVMDNYDGNRYFHFVQWREKSKIESGHKYYMKYQRTYKYNCFKIISFQ